MASELVSFSLDAERKVATLVMNDGKHQAVSFELCKALHAALDKAEKSESAVVLTGTGKSFCAGFHLATLMGGGKQSVDLLKEGFLVSERLLFYPYPVIIAVNGHAIAMGSFLCLSGDYRIGARGNYKVGANEVAIGLTMPHYAAEIMKLRLQKRFLQRSACLSEIFDPANAVEAGFIDELVDKKDLLRAAQDKAASCMKLNLTALAGTKLRTRNPDVLRAARERDDKELRSML